MHAKRPVDRIESGRPFLVAAVSLFFVCVFAPLCVGQDNCPFTFTVQAPTPAVDIETSLRVSAFSLALSIAAILISLFQTRGAHREPRFPIKEPPR